ncbi:integrase family protein [Marine Group I thaumarchaeote SCGC RSA3]|uniref:Integrase family protein n=2 Tax=Marine Group I TaxID=905826 RepID=A0A081RNC0_9ARCH|nr:integrase family protein [Marine Group I thaumarchaeote SCGC AAA799-N04]KFM19209.1 integrase family protein [Marine Group I thaumarchaeote SCGC RSA3]
MRDLNHPKVDQNSREFQVWLSTIHTKWTKISYVSGLERFILWSKNNKKPYIITGYADLADISKSRIDRILEDYMLHLNGIITANSVRSAIAGIKSFLEYHEVDYSKSKLKKHTPKTTKSVGNQSYSTEDIQKMLSVTLSSPEDTARKNALILTLCSSGIRAGAIEELKVGHISSIQDCNMVIVYKDQNEEYVTFMSPEARSAFEKYLEIRKSKGEEITADSWAFINTRSNSSRFKNYTKFKPLDSITVLRLISIVIEKTNIQRKKVTSTRFNIQTVHGFRKFFNTKLNHAKVHPNDIEKLMGHQNGLKGLYYTPQSKDLFESYKQGLSSLLVSQMDREIAKTKHLQDELVKTETESHQKVEVLSQKLNDALSRISELESEIQIRQKVQQVRDVIVPKSKREKELETIICNLKMKLESKQTSQITLSHDEAYLQ